ncbi:PucR family transcriptional regulator ligand-binding domain-containing protein [Kineosporia sp. J2-2]|uniref:PucR family transcriptional regulator ligand-binding domain-containing protein n=1 Tax=Kineosporia corallincola TaxID=2835133 RepID=A0ABS5TRF9_9ACTN|nr:PucR family transcriptional regulator ligand-binding domain-containing protein [Kineosporia corallincola]MBT0773379.1 PucR family transcriptional regulator ligand-binding domain-containing protein [Kineosporia corallincola]
MSYLTVADVVRLPVVRQGGPVVLAGHDRLTRPLRWVHATELSDIAPLLRPGDLVLTTGVGLPPDDDPAALREFARSLGEVECAGLMVEYGRRWRDALPEVLVSVCEELGLPLVALTHEVRFAAVIQTVGELVVDRQLAELRDAERVHETFTELSFAHAGPAEVLEAVRRLAAAPVVLENEQHRPLDFLPGPDDPVGFLDGWQARSARVTITGRTGWDEANGWLVTRLGTAERSWGRLVIGSPGRPPQRLIAVAERASASLALHRLHDRDRDNLTRRRHHELLVTLQSGEPSDDVLRACELAGLPVERRQFVGLVFRPRVVGSGRNDLDEVIASVVAATHVARTPALVCEIDREVRALLSLPRAVPADQAVDRVAERVGQRHALLVCAGSTAASSTTIDRTLLEARQVADSLPGDPAPGVHRLADVHLRGLLTLFGDDDRLRLFVDRELRQVREHDASPAGRGTALLPVLRALVNHPAGKSAAAGALHLSRAAFYDRLARLEKLLGVSLEDPDIRVSLHVALIADELSRQSASPG